MSSLVWRVYLFRGLVNWLKVGLHQPFFNLFSPASYGFCPLVSLDGLAMCLPVWMQRSGEGGVDEQDSL
jgi:hypothetical protein